MSKFQPQAGPQLSPAVPLPSDASVLIVKVWPVAVESPHWPCIWRVAVPVPVEPSVTLACILEKPQPVVPRRVISQFPVGSDLTMLPVVAELAALKEIIVASESPPRNVSRARLR